MGKVRYRLRNSFDTSRSCWGRSVAVVAAGAGVGLVVGSLG